jgi:hypothetical protein
MCPIQFQPFFIFYTFLIVYFKVNLKVVVIEHLFVFGHSVQEVHATNVYIYMGIIIGLIDIV